MTQEGFYMIDISDVTKHSPSATRTLTKRQKQQAPRPRGARNTYLSSVLNQPDFFPNFGKDVQHVLQLALRMRGHVARA